MTRRIKLDKVDRKILRDMQANGRISNVDLARSVGVTAPPCLRRVRALEEAGFIKGYHADLNAAMLGYGVTVFANVGLVSQSEGDLRRFQDHVDSWPEVRECYMLAGETDFVLKVVAADWDSYQKFLTSRLTAAPGVANIRSSLVIRTTKAQPGVPVDAE